jgi:hypothetical protein
VVRVELGHERTLVAPRRAGKGILGAFRGAGRACGRGLRAGLFFFAALKLYACVGQQLIQPPEQFLGLPYHLLAFRYLAKQELAFLSNSLHLLVLQLEIFRHRFPSIFEYGERRLLLMTLRHVACHTKKRSRIAGLRFADEDD